MNGLIGYTGFVGQNLDDPLFQCRYNSQTIERICGEQFDCLVCAGVPGHKTLANRFPQQDEEAIGRLFRCLRQVTCKIFVLISTIDVYKEACYGDEETEITLDGLAPYALHRAKLEKEVEQWFDQPFIIRLPGIFGKGLRKNFIFDLIFRIPRMMETDRMEGFADRISSDELNGLKECYAAGEQGMLVLKPGLSPSRLEWLRQLLERLDCTSLLFTDCRSRYSYYDLGNLKRDMERTLRSGIHRINLVTEPMTAAELAERAFGLTFTHTIDSRPPENLHIKSSYDGLFGGRDGYLYTKEQVIRQLQAFDKTSICI